MSWRSGQAYAQDLRDRVLAASGSIHQVAVRFGVSDSYVCRVRARYKRLGESTAGRQCGHQPCRLAGLEEALKARLTQKPNQRLDDLCAWVKTEHGIAISRSAMWKTLHRWGVTFKKNHSMPPSKSAPM